jgi:hypothetical protein
VSASLPELPTVVANIGLYAAVTTAVISCGVLVRQHIITPIRRRTQHEIGEILGGHIAPMVAAAVAKAVTDSMEPLTQRVSELEIGLAQAIGRLDQHLATTAALKTASDDMNTTLIRRLAEEGDR